jgi:hypothetical protein
MTINMTRTVLRPVQTTQSISATCSPHSALREATLHELSRVMGLPGRPNGMTGGEVEKYDRKAAFRRSQSTARPTR